MQSNLTASGKTPQAAPFLSPASVAAFAPAMLSILRLVIGLLFFEHGSSKLFGFPSPSSPHELFSLYWCSGTLELVGGALIAAGLFTRAASFIASGEMAFAYFLSHASHSFFPIINKGDSAILYCFVFLYIAVVGPGPWSIDAWLRRKN